jgi:anti-anti-sigma factor
LASLANFLSIKEARYMELEITLQRSDSAVILHATGRVDSNTAAQLQEPLLREAEGSSGAVELDLAQVSYMSSAGLRVLLQAAKALQKRGERLRLVKVPPHIHNILKLTGFTSFIDIES